MAGGQPGCGRWTTMQAVASGQPGCGRWTARLWPVDSQAMAGGQPGYVAGGQPGYGRQAVAGARSSRHSAFPMDPGEGQELREPGSGVVTTCFLAQGGRTTGGGTALSTRWLDS